MTRIRLVCLAIPFFLIAFAVQEGICQSNSQALVGRWNLTVHAPEGDFPAWLEVRKSGSKALVGSFVGQFGSARPIADIEMKDNSFRFAIPPQWEGRDSDIVIEGKIEGGKLVGESNIVENMSVKWIGERAPSLERKEKPEWGNEEPLFNGVDLAGWHARHSDRDNGWEVKNGILTNVKPGNDIISDKKFNDFKLVAEFRYPKGSNSGIYLRGRYEVQIEDNFGEEADSHHIGGIYGFLTPCTNAAKPAGEWQQVEITLVGRAVTVVLNGERVIDRQVIPGNTGGALDNHESEPGPILIQGDHGPVEFRTIKITPAK